MEKQSHTWLTMCDRLIKNHWRSSESLAHCWFLKYVRFRGFWLRCRSRWQMFSTVSTVRLHPACMMCYYPFWEILIIGLFCYY